MYSSLHTNDGFLKEYGVSDLFTKYITLKCQEKFEDTKGIIIILKSKDRQYNDQKKEKNERQTKINKHYKKKSH
jgi:hypothetical protein